MIILTEIKIASGSNDLENEDDNNKERLICKIMKHNNKIKRISRYVLLDHFVTLELSTHRSSTYVLPETPLDRMFYN